ncbi:MAG: VapC toxin family PIN domain ribonuclease [Gaiellaceae bacterium]
MSGRRPCGGRQIAKCPIVKLEWLRSARGSGEYDRLDSLLSALRDIAIIRSVINAALDAFRRLAHRGPLAQREMKLPALLIAAAAQDGSVGVLHYDAQFDRLAEVLDFESRWVAPAGSL